MKQKTVLTLRILPNQAKALEENRNKHARLLSNS